ncbi:MAG: YebC/PmpR family DNA-binding transcriptional regulator [Thermoanaerobaculia bacterium]|nr:YebC/PmpR family DNA-binding transcriptional regulator [Thermoanaerobaculia bacterium]
MAGHSKWANIKRRKEAQDAKRGKIFTRLLREVTIAARIGGGDPDGNPRLRSAVQDCKDNNVPNDNIARAVKKGTGDLEGSEYLELSYEGYAPGGVAVLVDTMTDNKNRTVSEVRHIFSKHGGNLGENGSVSYLFDQRGYFVFDPGSMSEEEFMELALELEVEDIATDRGALEMFTDPSRYIEVKEALAERDHKPAEAQLAKIPSTWVPVGPDTAPKVMRLLEAIEELDDVQYVWSNFEEPAEIAEAQAG